MEVGAASTTGYTPPQDIEAGLDPAVQHDAQQQNAAPSQEDAAAPPRGNSLPPDSAIHPSIATQLMQGVVNGAKEMANTVRADDEKKEQLGAWIDSGEQYIEGKIDQGRAWLRENGGTVGQKAADQIGLAEGVAISVYDTGKGLVQLADGAASLSSVREWIANPQANIARLKTVASSAETLGKLALLGNPATAQAAWMADPQGNAQLVGALWNSAATSFNKDPAKFTGNVVGTVAMMAVPVGGEAAIVGDVGRGTVLMGDASRIAEGADIAANINKAKTLAEVGNLAKPEPVIAEGANAAANAAKGEQNTAKVGSAASRVFTSTDPLVGSTATAIDRALPGAVKDVNVPIKNPKISLSSDADIMLKNGDVIEVKSGGGKGATTQVANQVKIIGNSGEVIVYGPDLKPSVINGIRGSGTKVFTNLDELISYIKSKGL